MTNEEKIYNITTARQLLDELRDHDKETVENYEIDKALLALQALSVYYSRQL